MSLVIDGRINFLFPGTGLFNALDCGHGDYWRNMESWVRNYLWVRVIHKYSYLFKEPNLRSYGLHLFDDICSSTKWFRVTWPLSSNFELDVCGGTGSLKI